MHDETEAQQAIDDFARLDVRRTPTHGQSSQSTGGTRHRASHLPVVDTRPDYGTIAQLGGFASPSAGHTLRPGTPL
jgi:hypothetical protein